MASVLIPLSCSIARPNFLLILVDDLNSSISTLGATQIHTPNLDKLATKSTLFTRAYCNAPACGPSRASLLTGQLPSTSGLYYNSQPILSKANGNSKLPANLPQHFKESGYTVGIYGKIFHTANRGDQLSMMATTGYFADHRGFWANIPDSIKSTLTDYRHEGGSNFAWGPVADDWESRHPLVDTENSNQIIEALQQDHDSPFLFSLGYLRPHLPWVAPQRFYDLYPIENIALPKGYMESDLDDLPECAKWMAHQVPGQTLGESFLQETILSGHNWKRAIQAYYASVSHMDDQLGRVLRALEQSSYRDNTTVIVASDHGYHLGEKEHWTKFGLWEQTLRVPLFISMPGESGQKSHTPVSLVDLFPTLVSLAGIESPHQKLDGVDLSPILENGTFSRENPVLSTYGYQNHSLRTDKYRLIRYRNGDMELYDHARDPYEFNNLANEPEHLSILENLKRRLPSVNAPETSSGSNLGWDPRVFEPHYQYQSR